MLLRGIPNLNMGRAHEIAKEIDREHEEDHSGQRR